MQRMMSLAIALVASTVVHAQEPIRIGIINVTSGQFADAGVQLDNGIKTYMQKHGDTVGGRRIDPQPTDRQQENVECTPPRWLRSSFTVHCFAHLLLLQRSRSECPLPGKDSPHRGESPPTGR